METPKTKDGLEKLPQELYDKIYHAVFAFDADVVTIDKHYVPPKQLHIDHTSRETFATRYYTNTIFQIDKGNEEAWLIWLALTPQHHRQQIRMNYYNVKPKAKSFTDSFKHAIIRSYWNLDGLLLFCRAFIQADYIFTNVVYQKNDGDVEEEWMHGRYLEGEWYKDGMPSKIPCTFHL